MNDKLKTMSIVDLAALENITKTVCLLIEKIGNNFAAQQSIHPSYQSSEYLKFQEEYKKYSDKYEKIIEEIKHRLDEI